MSEPAPPEAPSPRVAPYIQALGEDGALDFLLEYGGQTIHIPMREGSQLGRGIGEEKVAALRTALGQGALSVPTSRRWLAGRLDAKGLSRNDIAKRLRVTRESVRLYLSPRKQKAGA